MTTIFACKRPRNRAWLVSLSALAALTTTFNAHALNGDLGGTAYLSYDQAVWATLKPLESFKNMAYRELYGGQRIPTADIAGRRWAYPQLFVDKSAPAPLQPWWQATDAAIANGTSNPAAVAEWRVLDPAQQVPAAQPSGGWALAVDSLADGLDAGWAAGYRPSDFDLATGTGTIALGGSLRLHSDFNSPSGVLWMRGLTLERRSETESWYIGNNAGPAAGTFFELIDPVIGVNPDNGLLSIDADFKFGDSMYSRIFFQLEGDTRVVGHFSLNPRLDQNPGALVPVPGAVWLFLPTLLTLFGISRRQPLPPNAA
ncbi:hypothetical protein PL263_17645 [Methylomonas sp. EFPC3]|uniref:hypothetical protein n=1 Tax=Methylomonas sp. EFPC3 TaxID=3021710 RepID=UPI00241605C9|nr:hypothetical protein [Methylomonas sp. EFPC3]WFP49912.1 hypothetical protein PL263_17645 [Methylomonas sp. EFPC3]